MTQNNHWYKLVRNRGLMEGKWRIDGEGMGLFRGQDLRGELGWWLNPRLYDLDYERRIVCACK